MNLRRFCTMMLIALPWICAGGEGDGALRNIDFAVAANPTLAFDNAAWLSTLQTDRISVVQGAFRKENGELRDISGSADSFTASLNTRSYMKASGRLWLYGLMSYSYTMGHDMTGDLLLEPEKSPVNFLEWDFSNTGTKVSERYTLSGGMAYRTSPRWSFGIKADYTAADRAKLKDPRTSNSLMDLSVTAGFKHDLSQRASFGMNLVWNQYTDQIEAGVYGASETPYSVFVDYGALMGIREVFLGDEGHISLSNPRPLVNNYYGASLQFAAGGATRFSADLGYRFRDGFFGRPGSTNVTFCEFGGHLASLSAALLSQAGENLHRIALNGDFEYLANDENVYRITTVPGQSSVVTYYGQNRVLDKMSASALLSYTLFRGVSELNARDEYGVSLGARWIDGTTTIYPFYRDRSILAFSGKVRGKWGFEAAGGVLEPSLTLGFAFGEGTEASDGQLAQSSSEPPRTMEAALHARFEYETAPRAGATAALRYIRPLGGRLSIEAAIEDDFTTLVKENVHLAGKYYNIAQLRIGLIF